MAIEDLVVLSGLLQKAADEVGAALQVYEKERYLRVARVTVTPRIFGDIIHADGGGRDYTKASTWASASGLLFDGSGTR
jgi:2-polyprenyl-6-methoxyphenol hydroxylase-like FAD-dependent oxidoreductase